MKNEVVILTTGPLGKESNHNLEAVELLVMLTQVDASIVPKIRQIKTKT